MLLNFIPDNISHWEITGDFLAQPFLHKQITIVEGMSVKVGSAFYENALYYEGT